MPRIHLKRVDRSKPECRWIAERARNVHSQAGEDGMLEAIFEKIGSGRRWCVEFGAWDGVYLSNTRRLIEECGWSGVLIEADAQRCRDLQRVSADTPRVIPVHALVGWTPRDGLDAILADTSCPTDFDLLSIDIDGNDYHVWQAVERYRPRVVVIEYNSCIPTDVVFVQDADPEVSQGSSLLAMVELAKEKGYELIATNIFNAFFIVKEEFDKICIEDNSIDSLHNVQGMESRFVQCFDGTIFIAGLQKLVWHNIPFTFDDLQVLPQVMRGPGRVRPFDAMRLRQMGEVWIYGAGGGGRRVLDLLHANDVHVAGFIDSYKEGTLADLPVNRFSTFVRTADRSAPIVVASEFAQEIILNLLQQGFQRIYDAQQAALTPAAPEA